MLDELDAIQEYDMRGDTTIKSQEAQALRLKLGCVSAAQGPRTVHRGAGHRSPCISQKGAPAIILSLESAYCVISR